MVRINATYAHTSGENLMRGRNLNAPADGARPQPEFVNVVEVLGDARSRQHTLNVGASINFNTTPTGGPMMMNGAMMVFRGEGPPPPPPPPGGAPNPANKRWNWRRMAIFTNLGLGRALNNTDGAFSLPATGRIEDDWGPSNFDVRRRFNVSLNSTQLKNLNANLNFNSSSAPPYSIRTGIDTNSELLFTDRPAGVGRNSARASAQWTLNGNFSYGWTFGKPVERVGGISIRSEGGGMAVSQAAAQSTGRYRISLNVNAQNITNHANLVAYNGTLTAGPFFGKPSTFLSPRRIDIGMGLSF
jgi:hypothetical protein